MGTGETSVSPRCCSFTSAPPRQLRGLASCTGKCQQPAPSRRKLPRTTTSCFPVAPLGTSLPLPHPPLFPSTSHPSAVLRFFCCQQTHGCHQSTVQGLFVNLCPAPSHRLALHSPVPWHFGCGVPHPWHPALLQLEDFMALRRVAALRAQGRLRTLCATYTLGHPHCTCTLSRQCQSCRWERGTGKTGAGKERAWTKTKRRSTQREEEEEKQHQSWILHYLEELRGSGSIPPAEIPRQDRGSICQCQQWVPAAVAPSAHPTSAKHFQGPLLPCLLFT